MDENISKGTNAEETEKTYRYRTDNKSFMLYKEWEDIFGMLEDAEAGRLAKALFAYAKRGEAPEDFKGGLFMAFHIMSRQFDRDGEKWEQTCEKRSESGKKGGRPRKDSAEETGSDDDEESKKTKCFSEKPKEADKDKEKDKEKEKEKDIVKEKEKVKAKEKEKDKVKDKAREEEEEPERERSPYTDDDFLRAWNSSPGTALRSREEGGSLRRMGDMLQRNQ